MESEETSPAENGAAVQTAKSDSTPYVVGLKPWLPWPMSRNRWWTVPVPAERLAALRIGLALVLLADLFLTYLPNLHIWFGEGNLGGPELFDWWLNDKHRRWSLLAYTTNPTILFAALIIWNAATFGLLFGFCTRINAALVWTLSVSFANLNPYVDNAGDQIRTIALLYLIISPCGAVWSVDNWWRRKFKTMPHDIFVYPWALRLLVVQMAIIYFCNGVYKASGVDWKEGSSLYYVLSDMTLTRFSFVQLPLPYLLSRVMTWTVLVWELGFPLWVLLPWTRRIAWIFGALFHVGIFALMELGGFGPYMLVLYLPFLPWERLSQRLLKKNWS